MAFRKHLPKMAGEPHNHSRKRSLRLPSVSGTERTQFSARGNSGQLTATHHHCFKSDGGRRGKLESPPVFPLVPAHSLPVASLKRLFNAPTSLTKITPVTMHLFSLFVSVVAAVGAFAQTTAVADPSINTPTGVIQCLPVSSSRHILGLG